MEKENIVLIGFMGTGKTAVGKRLAAQLNLDFMDTDREIEAVTGMKIYEIFQKYGEKRFRAEECLAVNKAGTAGNCVIATGGGIVLNPNNVQKLREKGLIILLEARPEVIADRVRHNRTRPLLSGDEQLLPSIKELLKMRKHLYSDYDYKLDTSDLSLQQVVESIISYLKNQKFKETVMGMEFRINLGERSYPVLAGASLLVQLGRRLASLSLSPRVFVVTNETVGPLYGEQVVRTLERVGFQVMYRELPDGEEYKSLESAEQLYAQAITGGLERQGAVVALGGGVIGDLAGFVAATYMRGIPFIQVPTTLLAMVDSSVGGKVAVNHSLGKNMIGCFYQPRLVLADVETLKTLPVRELRAGLAEVIKYGVISDEQFFVFLEENIEKVFSLNQDVLIEIIKTSCDIKARIVEEDEREQGIRAVLNFGHTIGHALEAVTGYRVYRHGEAVAAGMAVAATIAANMGLCTPDLKLRLTTLLERAGLPTGVPFSAEQILDLLPRDKKARDGRPRFVLPQALGHVEISSSIPSEEIRSALDACREQGSESK